MTDANLDGLKSMIRLRMGAHDAHYAGDLVDGAKMRLIRQRESIKDQLRLERL